MSVVLVIISIVISIIDSVLPSLINTSKIRQTQAKLEKIGFALQGYMVTHFHLSCSDTSGNSHENLVSGTGSDYTCYTNTISYINIGLASVNNSYSEPISDAVYGVTGTKTSIIPYKFYDCTCGSIFHNQYPAYIV